MAVLSRWCRSWPWEVRATAPERTSSRAAAVRWAMDSPAAWASVFGAPAARAASCWCGTAGPLTAAILRVTQWR
ncbi:hypothetical protein [Nonomuraea basaltis]|uniref:hypothetical protein n=1 Tax=Nonomuraea basaltis TaxID=2495887 RepID=UPI00110C53C8|nr:hypothetical protein [Nonomuraea basaltis]TMR89009.1 hypothetical protein EJK15_63080 [Nonomuraea basaltis]